MSCRQQRDIRQALQAAPQLRPFIISSVKPTGRQLGGGSFGTVEELNVDGLVCAGKKLYDTLIHPENQGAQRMVDKYYNECSLLSDLRHPNIVQFLGICFLPDSRLPVLVMERLQGSLDELLENTVEIPLSTKVSILQDVARGLVYLHNRSPSVIHRDLSARNVLLNSAMTAKIADLGNSRIADILPGQLAQTMTRGIPGTLVYMPPEVSDEDHKYGPSLDMFSFGHLSLFVAIQVFPQSLLKHTYRDPKTKKIIGRSELERRGQYIDILHKTFGQCHSLVVLIKGCLEYEPVERPTASQALERLGEIKARVRDPYSDLNRLQLEKSLTEKEAEAGQISHLKSELKQLTEEKSRLERALSDERQRVSSLTDECATLKGRLEGMKMERMQRSDSFLEPNQIRILKAQKKELASHLDEKNDEIKKLQEQMKMLQMKRESSESRI